jgi:hypothetical protein
MKVKKAGGKNQVKAPTLRPPGFAGDAKGTPARR